MIKYINDKELNNILNSNDKVVMVFLKGNDCGVCQAAEFRINNIMSKKFPNLDIYYLDLDDSPEFRGQHLIFTIPTILLFEGNKEIHRESRIIDFSRLERNLKIIFDE
ncbi:MAG: thioredoxin family protein [Acholeplasmataceae bacterium]|nr:thioredoxin family protein [Acholeplasmataceae bacterium]